MCIIKMKRNPETILFASSLPVYFLQNKTTKKEKSMIVRVLLSKESFNHPQINKKRKRLMLCFWGRPWARKDANMAAAFSLPLKYLLHTEWHLFPTACLRALRVRSTVGSSSVLRNYGHYPQIQGNGRTGRQLSEMNVSLKFGVFFF